MVPRSVHVAHFSGDCFDGYWAKAVARKVRAAIRSSVSQQQDAGFTIAKGNTPQLVDDFYQVYLRWADWRASQRRIPRPLARWRASRLETFAKFAAVAAELGGHCHLSVAHWQGRPVGAVWCLRAGETAIGWRAYTDRTVPTRFRVFETLAAAAMRDAFEAGCRHFELGESAGQPGLAVIKERLGGREHLFAEYHFERLPLTAARLARHRVQGRAETWLLRHAPPRPGTAPPAPGDLSAPAAARRAGKLSHVMG
jgi:hypothetical protein